MSEKLAQARQFAIEAHGDQKYGSHPYSHHLDAVAELLQKYGEQAVIVGYLHDTVEDTEVTLDDVAAAFGAEIAELVALVTDESGVNRRERKERTNAKLTATSKTLALIVKAADRLANLLESKNSSSDSKLKMYRREHAAFRQAVYRPGICENLWAEIEDIIGLEDLEN